MTKRMLIDASHAEETRVVVIDGNRLEDFDVETSAKRQLKGNIYLAKVVRVEPSLQAAFVEYGGNRHGFLAFSEIHPDYYQIPVADRQRLLEMEAEEARREEEEADLEIALDQAQAEAPVHDAPLTGAPAGEAPAGEAPVVGAPAAVPFQDPASVPFQDPASVPVQDAGVLDPPRHDRDAGDLSAPDAAPEADASAAEAAGTDAQASAGLPTGQPLAIEPDSLSGPVESATQADSPSGTGRPAAETEDAPEPTGDPARPKQLAQSPEAAELFSGAGNQERDSDPRDGFEARAGDQARRTDDDEDAGDEDDEDTDLAEPAPETVGGDNDSGEERAERRLPPRFLRNYKIQEVIRRRQILLVQVVKEERGTKGAALTTYISLAGRFSVLMPNSPRGGGISRKITSATDRRRLKEVMTELAIPRGMGLIVRTAGANRPKPEIKRDCEYLLRLWDDIRDHTMNSVAPALIYEEASLIKRAIRDVYSRDVDDIMVDGEEGWRAAHDFMRMLMPTHAKKVQLWRDTMPLFARFQVEAQLDSMLLPTVQLRSGGYLVINQAEALVAIDVNSGRSTRERGIEETALRTNLEAADEVARQLRLRDLAGLIVIDFIDMEHRKHNAMVERRLKEALKNDRARIQVGQISHFGLMEMSRQRLRPSLAETSFVGCPHCGGTGHVRSTESAAIHVLRGIEDEGGKRRAAEIVVHVATPIALYLLNHKRERLREIEQRYAMRVIIAADDSQFASQYRVERVRPQITAEVLPVITPDVPQITAPAASAVAEDESDQDEDGDEEEDDTVDARAEDGAPEGTRETAEEAEHRRRRRRRRRRGRRDDAPGSASGPEGTDPPAIMVGEGVHGAEFVSQAAAGIAAADQAVTSGVERHDPQGPDADSAGASYRGDFGAGAAGMAGLDADSASEAGVSATGLGAAGMSSAASRATGAGTTGAGTTGLGATGPGATGLGATGPGATGLGSGNAGQAASGGVTEETASGDMGTSGVSEFIEGVPEPVESVGGDDDPRNRRRGRRGGRRRRREAGDELTPLAEPDAEQPEVPHYSGPTPANPFGGQAFDIFDVLDQAERGLPPAREQPAPPPPPTAGDVPRPASDASADPGFQALEPSRAEIMASATVPPFGHSEETAGGPDPEEVTAAVDFGTAVQTSNGGEPVVTAAAPQDDAGGADVDANQNALAGAQSSSDAGGSALADAADAVQVAEGADERIQPPEDAGSNMLADPGVPAGADGSAVTDVEIASGGEDDFGRGGAEGSIANQAAPEPALTQPFENPESFNETTASIAVTPGSDAVTPDHQAEPPDVSLTVRPAHVEEAPPAPANDASAQAEPAVRPIVIGSADSPPVEKKRGWWRR